MRLPIRSSVYFAVAAIALACAVAPAAALTRFGDMSLAGSRARTTSAAVAAVAPHTLGSSQPITAEPPVARPNETPCVVTLYSNVRFVDFSQHLWRYAPPAACPGPWQEVVLDADFNVTAGIQFDRTANIWIAGTNVYFGTTAEPGPTLSPSWHVERDITDLSPILKSASTGQVVLGNIVNSTYTGIISSSARLEFYPRQGDRAPFVPHALRQTPDAVYPMSADPRLGGAVYLYQPTDQNALTATFPRNVERAYLDVTLQSQIGDEFWYSCFPDDLAAQTNNCGHTGFREGEVTVDGQPAGVAPVFPWVYSGGIDPYLWFPIPGVETYDFRPYRVDLTPFAGRLSDGHPHTIAFSVFNDDNYFATTASLLLFLDHGATTVSGGVISDTTAASPAVTIVDHVTDNNGTFTGPVDVSAAHAVLVDGFVNTSHGRVETRVAQSISFANDQTVRISSTEYGQNITQETKIVSDVTTWGGHGGARTDARSTQDWPFVLDYDFVVNPDGSASQNALVRQQKLASGFPPFVGLQSNAAQSHDLLVFPASGGYGPTNPRSSQQYLGRGAGPCYDHLIKAFDNALTASIFGGC